MDMGRSTSSCDICGRTGCWLSMDLYAPRGSDVWLCDACAVEPDVRSTRVPSVGRDNDVLAAVTRPGTRAVLHRIRDDGDPCGWTLVYELGDGLTVTVDDLGLL